MHEPDLAQRLSLLATEVDSLAKALVQAQAERAREAERKKRADAEAEQHLRHAAQEAQHSRGASPSVVDEATLVPSREPDNGW